MNPADYQFNGGYPSAKTVQKAYDDADLVRAIQAYKFFFPTVSINACWDGNAPGVAPEYRRDADARQPDADGVHARRSTDSGSPAISSWWTN